MKSPTCSVDVVNSGWIKKSQAVKKNQIWAKTKTVFTLQESNLLNFFFNQSAIAE